MIIMGSKVCNIITNICWKYEQFSILILEWPNKKFISPHALSSEGPSCWQNSKHGSSYSPKRGSPESLHTRLDKSDTLSSYRNHSTSFTFNFTAQCQVCHKTHPYFLSYVSNTSANVCASELSNSESTLSRKCQACIFRINDYIW